MTATTGRSPILIGSCPGLARELKLDSLAAWKDARPEVSGLQGRLGLCQGLFALSVI